MPRPRSHSYSLRLLPTLLFLGLVGNVPLELRAQQAPAGTNTAAGFLAEVALKYPTLAATKSFTLNASANWTLGSQKESGTAVLQAQADGSSSLQLALDKASRTESRTALGANRACQWTDGTGTHNLNDPDCNRPVAWFAPALAVQPIASVLQMLNVSDDGSVTRNTGSFRSISYRTPLAATSSDFTNFLTEGTRVTVLFDPQTLLPSSVEYLEHGDADLNTTFPVRIVYSNYQAVSGTPVPYQIDRYVNNVLQLSLTVTNVTLQ